MLSKKELIDFEEEIGNLFNSRMIKAPIHLYDGNEDQIIEVFKKVDIEKDWICCTWRSHYQALLKGIPRNFLREKIIQGKSMVLNLPEYKFICSSIVGGIPSIAVGIASAAKMKNSGEKVWCWVGDMSAETGAWSEAYRYAVAHQLPITFIVEDNGVSVLTPTKEVWGDKKWYLPTECDWVESQNLIYYKYKNEKYPHAGAGVRVQF